MLEFLPVLKVRMALCTVTRKMIHLASAGMRRTAAVRLGLLYQRALKVTMMVLQRDENEPCLPAPAGPGNHT